MLPPVAALLGAALLAAGGARADESQLDALLAGMTSYQATFEQTLLNRFGEALQTTTGSVHVQRPGRMRWSVDAPYPQLLLADGRSLWIYDPDLEQVSVQPLADAIDGSPAAFLTGLGSDVAEHFIVRAAQPPLADGKRFVLKPRDGASVFRDATLTFSPDGALAALDIGDHLDQTTRIVFTDVAVNQALEPSLFEFEIPAGVDVVGEPPDGQAAGAP